MKRIIFIAAILIGMSAGTAQSRTYKIALVAWVGWAPATIAEVKGFWKEQGLDVKTVALPDPLPVNNLLKNRRVDIVFGMIGNVIGMRAEGVPAAVIAETDWSHGGDEIIVKKDMDMTKLKGRTLGVYLNQPPIIYFLHKYLSGLNLNFSDFRIVEMETEGLTDNFVADRFDMIVSYAPEAVRAIKDGKGKLAATSADYEGCIPQGMMAVKDVLDKIPKDDLAGICKGWIKAAEWSQDSKNWKEYVDILNRYMYQTDKPYSEEEIRNMLNTERIHNVAVLRERNRKSGGLENYLNDLQTFLKANNIFRQDTDTDEIFDNSVIMKVLEEVRSEK